MKYIFQLISCLLVFSSAISQDFVVNDYSVQINVRKEGYFEVVEKYDLTFETHKHGIFRTIQTSYDLLEADGTRTKRKIRISHIEVPNHKFEAPFEFEQKLSDKITIKIGDPEISLIGRNHYEIRYRVHNAFLFEDPHTRFYWNIKPDGWQADFEKIEFQVHLPEDIQINESDIFVYSGSYGTDTLSEEFEWQHKANIITGNSKEPFISRSGQSVTLLLNLPAGSIREEKPLWPFWNEYGWSLLVGALFIGFFTIWRKFGKDDKVIPTTTYYPPEGLDPAMAGFLINDRDDASDLIALLPYWGFKGLLEIEEIPKKWLFGKKDTMLRCLKDLPNNAQPYEREIFTGLFGHPPVIGEKSELSREEAAITLSANTRTVHKVKPVAGPGEILVSSLKNTFYSTMNNARGTLKSKAQQFYEARSLKVKWITLALLIVGGILLTLLGLFYWGILAALGLLLSCVILIFLNTYMIKRNPRGNILLSELKGFREFIKVAEEHKLKMLLEEDPGYFEGTMGYALAFGLFEKWAKKFAELNVPPPNWYRNTGTGHYNMNNFSKSFSGVMAGVQSTMVSSPSSSGGSSGGGSSGGGFGGGGGGSW